MNRSTCCSWKSLWYQHKLLWVYISRPNARNLRGEASSPSKILNSCKKFLGRERIFLIFWFPMRNTLNSWKISSHPILWSKFSIQLYNCTTTVCSLTFEKFHHAINIIFQFNLHGRIFLTQYHITSNISRDGVTEYKPSNKPSFDPPQKLPWKDTLLKILKMTKERKKMLK